MAGDQHSSNENGKHACESGPGNTRDFGEHATKGGNKRDFSWVALEVEVGGGSSN